MAKKERSQLIDASTLYGTVAETEAAAVKSRAGQESMNVELQRIACSHLVHLGKHKDIRVIRNFLENHMHEAMRKDSMTAFFVKFGLATVDAEGNIGIDTSKPTMLGLALETAWWKLTKPTVYRGWVFEEQLASFIAQAEKHLLKPKEGDKVTPQQVAAIANLKAQMTTAAQTGEVATKATKKASGKPVEEVAA